MLLAKFASEIHVSMPYTDLQHQIWIQERRKQIKRGKESIEL